MKLTFHPFTPFLLLTAAFGLFASACGPAAEDRSTMMSRAKQVQDSIAFVIRSQMAEAEAPGPMQQAPVQAAPAGSSVAPPPSSMPAHTHAPGEVHNH